MDKEKILVPGHMERAIYVSLDGLEVYVHARDGTLLSIAIFNESEKGDRGFERAKRTAEEFWANSEITENERGTLWQCGPAR